MILLYRLKRICQFHFEMRYFLQRGGVKGWKTLWAKECGQWNETLGEPFSWYLEYFGAIGTASEGLEGYTA